MSTKLQPNSDRVLVKKDEFKSTAGLILAPSAELSGPYSATVVAVGPGRERDAAGLRPGLDFRVGDRVLVDSIGGLKIELNGESYILVRNEEILGIFSVE